MEIPAAISPVTAIGFEIGLAYFPAMEQLPSPETVSETALWQTQGPTRNRCLHHPLLPA